MRRKSMKDASSPDRSSKKEKKKGKRTSLYALLPFSIGRIVLATSACSASCASRSCTRSASCDSSWRRRVYASTTSRSVLYSTVDDDGEVDAEAMLFSDLRFLSLFF